LRYKRRIIVFVNYRDDSLLCKAPQAALAHILLAKRASDEIHTNYDE
jgi:hypothetical protein